MTRAQMDQLGHTDLTFTLRVYRHGMRRDDRSRMALRSLVSGAEVQEQPSPAAGTGEQVGAVRA